MPANFVGYGTFSIAAMVAFAYLIKVNAADTNWKALAPLFILGVLLCLEPLAFSRSGFSDFWALYFGSRLSLWAAWILGRRELLRPCPHSRCWTTFMYRAIAIGFAFFTVATIFGCALAAELGTYWQWDPKENLGADCSG